MTSSWFARSVKQWLRPPGAAFWGGACGAVTVFSAGVAAAAIGYWILAPLVVAVLAVCVTALWRRRRGHFESPVTVTPNLVLIALPTLLASSTINLKVVIYVVTILIALLLWMKPTGSIQLTWPCALLPLIGCAIVARPNYPGALLDVLYFALACVIITRAVQLSASRESALISLLDGIGLFLITSVSLHYLGFAGNQTDGDSSNTLTGGARVAFPLAYSQAAPPAMAATFLAAVVPILVTSRQHRLPRLVAVLAALQILVLSDRRASLIGAVLLASCVMLIPRFVRSIAPWLTGLLLIAPFIHEIISMTVGRVVLAATSYAPWFVRPEEDVGSLNGRTYIWSQTITFFQERVDWVHQAIGFGSYGQAVSGASLQYSNMFGSSYLDRTLLTPHNSLLQVLLDGGWLIAAVYGATIVFMAWRASRRISIIDVTGLAMFTALMIGGVTEVALSPSHSPPTWWVFVALGIIVFARDKAAAVPDIDEPTVIESSPATDVSPTRSIASATSASRNGGASETGSHEARRP